MTELEESLAGRTRALIEQRMPQKNLTQLQSEMRVQHLGRTLQQAEKGRYIPLDIVVAIHEATGITIGELCIAMFADAGYGEYLPYLDIDRGAVQAAMDILMAPPKERDVLISILVWMRSLQQAEDGQT